MSMFETQNDLLPALMIEVSGIVKHSNLDAFRAAALERIGAVNRDLRTDQDFAQAEQAVKWCSDIESRLSTAKAAALAQTAGIDQLFRAIDDISAEARKVRLELSKLVTMRKDEVKGEICASAIAALREYVATLSQSVGITVPAVPVDLAQAIKGRRTVAGLQDAVSVELGRAVYAAGALAERMTANLREMSRRPECGLFPDRAALAVRHPGEVLAIIDERVAAREAEEKRKEQERQAAEQRRLEAERARIRAEEQARADAEQQAERDRLAAERRQIEAAAEAESQRVAALEAEQRRVQAAAEAEQRRAAQALADERAAFDRQQAEALEVERQRAKDAQGAEDARRRALWLEEQAKTAPAPIPMQPAPAAADEPATLKLGDINARLAPISLSAAGLAELGIAHGATNKAAKLYRESDWPLICAALIRHIEQAKP